MADRPDDDAGRVDDERWAQIVAQLGDVEAAADAASPHASSPTPPPTPNSGAAAGLEFPVAAGVESPFGSTGRDWDGTEQYDEAERSVDEDEGFVPPDPGPVLGGDPLLTMAWFAVGGMPLFLLVVLIFWQAAPAALVQAACVVFVLGVALLLWRMPARRGDHDDDGNGAVV